jgi:heparin binding hemagglutinin HbhA
MSEKQQKYPRPLYAAAGASDLAAEKLRTLPDRMAGLSEWARGELSGGRGRAQGELAELGERLGAGLASVRDRAQDLGTSLSGGDMRTDLRRFQKVARRRAGELANAAARNLATAQGRAVHVYDDLVARGTAVLEGPEAEAPGELAEPPAAPAIEDRPAKKMAKKATRPVTRKPSATDE